MSTGQTIFAIGAFVLLTTILQGVYTSLSNVGTDIESAQDGILETTIATSYSELANGLAFDNVTSNSDTALFTPNALTYPPSKEAGEDSIQDFDDFDDFNGYSEIRAAGNSNRRYQTKFTVSYADTNNIQNTVLYRTYVKRLDMKTWRVYPPPVPDEVLDTLMTTLVMGYFHFD
jgi:hypothetical protein